LVNKYDGIDLPFDACHLLVLDGLPEAYGAIDRADANAIEDTPAFMGRQIQRIEQGMGRGVRSNDDYCVVLLLGARLTERIWATGGLASFSPATRAQLMLSQRLSDLLRGQPLEGLRTIINQCLDRDPGWVKAARAALDGITYDAGHVRSDAIAEREAFALAEVTRYRVASGRMQAAADRATSREHRGWLKQQAARYLHHVDPVGAQVLQQSAIADNRGLLKPRAGVEYVRLSAVADQAAKCAVYLGSRYDSGAALILGFTALLSDLEPDPDQAAVRRFEGAVTELGLHLGFGSQRPERDTGSGPDVLWSVGNLDFFVIECKSGAIAQTIPRHDAEQLGHSMDWFRETYDESCTATPVLIHPSNVQHSGTFLRNGARIVTFDRLSRLRKAVAEFAAAIADNFVSPDAVRPRLVDKSLNAGQFLNTWSVVGRPS